VVVVELWGVVVVVVEVVVVVDEAGAASLLGGAVVGVVVVVGATWAPAYGAAATVEAARITATAVAVRLTRASKRVPSGRGFRRGRAWGTWDDLSGDLVTSGLHPARLFSRGSDVVRAAPASWTRTPP